MSNTPEIIRYDFVILGGGIAGVSCAETLGILTTNSAGLTIAVISASALVKAAVNVQQVGFVMESIDVEEKESAYLTARFPNISILIGFVTSLDTENKMLILTTYKENVQTAIKYGRLCIATGASPKTFFSHIPHVLSIRDTESVQQFKHKLSGASRIAVVGNGGIATELVYEVKSCKVIWCIKHNNISAAFFDESAAHFFLPHIQTSSDKTQRISKRWVYTAPIPTKTSEEAEAVEFSSSSFACSHGNALGPDWSHAVELTGSANEETENNEKVKVEYNVEVKSIYTASEFFDSNLQESDQQSQHQWPVYVHLSNNKVFGVDLVINATGVQPSLNIDIKGNETLKSQSDGGLAIDTEMRTCAKFIYAAGDIADTSQWNQSELWHQMRLWTQAKQMGCYAAKCMYYHHTDQAVTMDFCFELFSHVTEFFGFRVVLLGLYNAQSLSVTDYQVQIRCTPGHEFIKVILSNHRVVGAVLIGDTDMEETLENLILNKLDIGHIEEHLLEPGIDIDDYFD